LRKYTRNWSCNRKGFAEQGAACILIARNEAGLKEAIPQLSSKHNQKHEYRVADFSKPDDVRKIIAGICSQVTIHVLVNNTGGPSAGPIIDAPEEAFVKAFEQHLVCNHILTKAVVPGMKKAGYAGSSISFRLLSGFH
jgi:3-oxoacyl-[acyl-carrier protein] reductase